MNTIVRTIFLLKIIWLDIVTSLFIEILRLNKYM